MGSGLRDALEDAAAGLKMLHEHQHTTILSLHAQNEEGTFVLFGSISSDVRFEILLY
jgi:hypothetical protein